MREIDITARGGTFTDRTAAAKEKSVADRRSSKPLELLAAQECGKPKPPVRVEAQRGSAKQLNPMPWCKHPAASAFGRLCTDQLKAWRRTKS